MIRPQKSEGTTRMSESRTTRRLSTGLDRLRGFRSRPKPEAAVGDLAAQLIKGLKRQSSRQESVQAILHEILNERLSSGLVIVKIAGDVLHLKVGHPTQRFSIDRACSQEHAKRLLARAGITRIRWTSR